MKKEKTILFLIKEENTIIKEHVTRATERWEKFITDNKDNSDAILKFLTGDKNSSLAIPKADYSQWRASIPSDSSSISVYLGLNEALNKLAFYFIDSYSANLSIPTLTEQAQTQILKCSFSDNHKGPDNSQDPDNPKDPEIVKTSIKAVEAKRRYDDWNDVDQRNSWAKSMLKTGDMVLLFTIPKEDFHSAFYYVNSNESAYLYFGLTTDERPNNHPKKIELIISNYPPPQFDSSGNSPVHYYNISIPYPPF